MNHDLFTYDYYREILGLLKSNFNICLFSDIESSEHNSIILRHDVDVSVEEALKMAQIEHDEGVCSNYMIMTDSIFYDLDDKNIKSLKKIIDLGHHVGLHYDFKENDISISEENIVRYSGYLGGMIGQDIISLSFHSFSSLSFSPYFLKDRFHFGQNINSFFSDFMNYYISDSRGRWESSYMPELLSNKGRFKWFQFLIHPIWWGEKSLSPKDRIIEYINRNGEESENKVKVGLPTFYKDFFREESI